MKTSLKYYKLWLAGQQRNWVLAEYERHQLSGGFKRIEKYHKGTPEAAAVLMIYPEIEAIEKAISQKDTAAFNHHFGMLTTVCNTCHQATRDNCDPLASFDEMDHSFTGRYELLSLCGVGHFPLREAPEAVGRALIRHFKS